MSTTAGIDNDDILLITQMLREDGEKAMCAATGKGKQAEGLETDTQTAIRFLLEELQQLEAFAADRRIARSMQHAICIDGNALQQAQHEEQSAHDDHNLSLAINNPVGNCVSSASALSTIQRTPESPTDDEDFIEKLSYLYVTGFDDDDTDEDEYDDEDTLLDGQPETSSWAASRRTNSTRRKRRCEACGDRRHFAELAQAPCRHEYCASCLKTLFENSMVDESLFPPRCCKQTIPLDKNRLFLDANLANKFREKAVEFSTPNRTYCHNRNCTAFIPTAKHTQTTAPCDKCRSLTCITCKNASHDGDCPHDRELQQVIQMARDQGWQRCQSCWGLVELKTGCNHMTCRCGYQFCYNCGAQWKTCRCEHWDEHRLLERAIQIDARDQVEEAPEEVMPAQITDTTLQENVAGHAEPEAPPEAVQGELDCQSEEHKVRRQQRVQAIMQDLNDNHECGHQRWDNRAGRRRCEECSDVMPNFTYECRQCHIIACRRCRRHRL